MLAIMIFFVNGKFDGVCEDWASALNVEAYLSGVSNNVEVVTVLGATLEDCWQWCNKVTL